MVSYWNCMCVTYRTSCKLEILVCLDSAFSLYNSRKCLYMILRHASEFGNNMSNKIASMRKRCMMAQRKDTFVISLNFFLWGLRFVSCGFCKLLLIKVQGQGYGHGNAMHALDRHHSERENSDISDTMTTEMTWATDSCSHAHQTSLQWPLRSPTSDCGIDVKVHCSSWYDIHSHG